ncbi:MAG: GNAT family N-acetyltransferase [Chloroflexota bacterium]
MTTRFRHPSADDHPAVAEVVDEWSGGRRVRARLPRLWLEHFGSTSWVAETDSGRLAGFLVGFVSPDRPTEGVIHLLAIDPNDVGRDVDRDLVEQFAACVRDQGVTRLVTVLPPDDRRAIDRWRALGWVLDEGPGTARIWGVPARPDHDGPGEDRAILSRPA